MNANIEKYMTLAPVTIGRGTTIRDALLLMRSKGVRHLPVMERDALVGLVSERELEIVSAISSIDPERTSVEIAMAPDPFTVELGSSLAVVASAMAAAKVGSAVVTSDGRPVGIFTTVDALMALAALLG